MVLSSPALPETLNPSSYKPVRVNIKSRSMNDFDGIIEAFLMSEILLMLHFFTIKTEQDTAQ